MWASYRDDLGKLILRLTVAVLLGFHGVSKLKNGIGWMAGPLRAHHLLMFVGYGVYVAEAWAPYGGWAKVSDGVVSPDGASVTTVDGGGLPELSAVGVRLAATTP